jgi:hypothetical protein
VRGIKRKEKEQNAVTNGLMKLANSNFTQEEDTKVKTKLLLKDEDT